MYLRVVCLSVTLVHSAKAAGRNEMPFGRDTRVAPSNIVLDGDPGAAREGDIWGVGTPNRRAQTAAANIFTSIR